MNNTPVYHISQQPSYHTFFNISSLISRNANELGISGKKSGSCLCSWHSLFIFYTPLNENQCKWMVERDDWFSCPVSSQGGSTGVQFVDGINFAISFTFHSLQMQMLINSLITYQSIPFLPLRAIFQGRVVFDLPFAFLVSYRFFKPNTFFSKAF